MSFVLKGVLAEASQGAPPLPKPPTPAWKRPRPVERPHPPTQNTVATSFTSTSDSLNPSVASNALHRRDSSPENHDGLHPSYDGSVDRITHLDHSNSGHSCDTTPNNSGNHPSSPHRDLPRQHTQHPRASNHREAQSPRGYSHPDMATPWEDPVELPTPGSPVIDDYLPQSPNMDDLPKTDSILFSRVARKRRDGFPTKSVPHYWLRKNNEIPTRPNEAAKQNRYGPQYVINPTSLKTKFTRARGQTHAGPFKSSSDRHLYQPPKMILPPIDVDKIIAKFQQPHPKLVAQAEIRKQKEIQERNMRTDRPRQNDSYRPKEDHVRGSPRPRLPDRQWSSLKYSTWSKNDLRDEAEVRRLDLEEDHTEYFMAILEVDDNSFQKSYYTIKNRCATLAELRHEADRNQMSIDYSRSYDYYELLEEVAGKIGCDAVYAYNQDLKHHRIIELQAANERAQAKKRHERALKAQQAEAEKTKNNAAQLVKAAAQEPRLKKKNKQKRTDVLMRKGSQSSSDSGYSTVMHQSMTSTATSISGHESSSNHTQDIESRGTKRQRVVQDDEDDNTPSKKTRASPKETPRRVIKSARSSRLSTRKPRTKPVIEEDTDTDVEMTDADESIAVEAPKRGITTIKSKKSTASAPQKANKGIAHSATAKKAGVATKVIKKSKNEIESSAEDSDVTVEENWLVDDTKHKRKRKSRVGEMAASGLVAGMK